MRCAGVKTCPAGRRVVKLVAGRGRPGHPERAEAPEAEEVSPGMSRRMTGARAPRCQKTIAVDDGVRMRARALSPVTTTAQRGRRLLGSDEENRADQLWAELPLAVQFMPLRR